jgi:dienelactone hydrolase
LVVAPRVALADVPVEIAVTGLSPGASAQLRQTATDYAGRRWTGGVRVRADARGRVGLRGNAAMRVLWSMQPAGGSSPLRGPFHVGWRLDFVVRVDLVAGGHVVDGVTLKRRELAPGERAESVSVGRAGFVGEAFMPPAGAGGKHPGVLVFGGSEGGLHLERYAALFAAHGYPSVAIAYFGEPGLPKSLVRVPLEYFAGALHWLARRPGVDPHRLVVLGVSRGSEAAQLLGVHYPDLVHGVVALVPSNTPNCGIPPVNVAHARCIGPAWTFRGRAIPYNHEGASPDATPQIPDEQIDGPIFLDCGGEDDLWLSCPMAHAIVDRLREHTSPTR